MTLKKPVIAIDGSAASGKGTLAKSLASKLGFAYLDTGKLYRAIGVRASKANADFDNEQEITAIAQKFAEEIMRDFSSEILADPELKTADAGNYASKVALLKGVRTALNDFQRGFAQNPPNNANGAVLDGRDIGTVICPDAELKLFIDANTEIRAKRRYKELHSAGFTVTYEAVLSDMMERDARDSKRSLAPQKPALDAILIDSSDMNPDEVLQKVLKLVPSHFR